MLLTIVSGLNLDIAEYSIEADRQFRSLLHENYAEAWPHISRDGRWMAYMSNKSGRHEIYVRPFPEVDSGGPWPISTEGGTQPLWSPNSPELFYRNGNTVMAVSIKADSGFSRRKPEPLFSGEYVSGASLLPESAWDISPDGKFLMMKEAGPTKAADSFPRKIIVVLNCLEELKQRVPGK